MNQICFLFFISLTLHVTQILSWGATGHMIIAQIALNQLNATNPSLFSKINAVVNGLDNLTNGWSNSFVEAAPWPDDLKYTGYSFLNTWHYVDLFINPNNPPTKPFADDEMNDVELDILYGMDQCEKVIRNSQEGFTVSMENSMMTRFIIHLVGDVHQVIILVYYICKPQHCSALQDADYPTGDAGGNLYKVNCTIYNYTNGNLHSIWDYALFQIPTIYRPLNDSSKQYLQQMAQNLTSQYSRYFFGDRLARSRTGWAKEGQYYAWAYAYQPLMTSANPHLITQEYIDNGWEIIKQQFTIAGYRLADTLTYFFTHPYAENEIKEDVQSQ